MPIWSRRRRARASSSSGPRSLAGHLDPARGGALQAARHHHQARLAGARGADHGGDLAGGDVESDAAQDIDHAGIACHVEMDVGEADDGDSRAIGRGGQAGSGREAMNLGIGYGRFAAAVNSLLIAILCLACACRRRMHKPRPSRLADPGRQPGGGLRRQPGPGDPGPARGRAQEGTAATSPSSITASRATPRRAGSSGSTGCWPTSPTS